MPKLPVASIKERRKWRQNKHRGNEHISSIAPRLVKALSRKHTEIYI
jgi:hypothetical protein